MGKLSPEEIEEDDRVWASAKFLSSQEQWHNQSCDQFSSA
jgi:hypothetical protein